VDSTILPDIQIRYTVHDHIIAYKRLHAEALWQLQQARTTTERMDAQQWVDSAERQLTRWQALLDRTRRA
jgi:hypothetical protein